MPKNITQYDLLISCPGDIKEEMTIIEEVVNQFNENFSGVSIRTRHWSKSSYTESGGKPQALLNKQFINDCDAAIAVFWTRFGTPTDKYGSGTEEEIELMLESNKQLFLYFSNISLSPNKIDATQYDKVQDFKKRYTDRGLFFEYDNIETFKKRLYNDITKYFLSLDAVNEIKYEKKSLLSIKAIGENQQLEENILSVPFKTSVQKSVADMMEETKNIFEKINSYPSWDNPVIVENTNDITIPTISLYKSVEITEKTKKYLIEYAELLDIELADNFFSLGELKESAFLFPLGGSSELKGTKEGIEKYNSIIDLKNKLVEVNNWYCFEDIFSKLQCIRLCIENTGTTFDEDIEICLCFPKDMLITPNDLPYASDFDIMQTEYYYDDIFGIPKTAIYYDFAESVKRLTPALPTIPSPMPTVGQILSGGGSGKSFEEDYYETLYETFNYDFFCEKDCIIVKLKVDYIKHNTAVAFPTVLFVTDKVSDIEYKITSKHSDIHFEGMLKSVKTLSRNGKERDNE